MGDRLCFEGRTEDFAVGLGWVATCGGLENAMEWAIATAGKILRVQQQVAGCKCGDGEGGGRREGGSRSDGHSRERGSGGKGGKRRIALLQESFKRYLSVEGRKGRTNGRFLSLPQ